MTGAPEAVSLLGDSLYASPPGANVEELEAKLAAGRADMARKPDDPEKIVWVGRRLGYLWRMNEAIEVYTDGIGRFPDYAPLYRHRGHRYISLRRFDKARGDLEKAVELIAGRSDPIEPDGMPNAQNIPLTTLAFNVWYHLGLARYLQGDFEGALAAYRETMKHTRGYDDNVVAVADWTYMALRLVGREEEATALLDSITPDMTIIENAAYHRRLLMYKGLIGPEELLDMEDPADLDLATLGYGLGNWYLHKGDRKRAIEVFEQVTTGPYWPAFGFIAAEVELARMRGRAGEE